MRIVVGIDVGWYFVIDIALRCAHFTKTHDILCFHILAQAYVDVRSADGLKVFVPHISLSIGFDNPNSAAGRMPGSPGYGSSVSLDWDLNGGCCIVLMCGGLLGCTWLYRRWSGWRERIIRFESSLGVLSCQSRRRNWCTRYSFLQRTPLLLCRSDR